MKTEEIIEIIKKALEANRNNCPFFVNQILLDLSYHLEECIKKEHRKDNKEKPRWIVDLDECEKSFDDDVFWTLECGCEKKRGDLCRYTYKPCEDHKIDDEEENPQCMFDLDITDEDAECECKKSECLGTVFTYKCEIHRDKVKFDEIPFLDPVLNKKIEKEPQKIRFKWSGNTYEIECGEYSMGFNINCQSGIAYIEKGIVNRTPTDPKERQHTLILNHNEMINRFCSSEHPNLFMNVIKCVPEVL